MRNLHFQKLSKQRKSYKGNGCFKGVLKDYQENSALFVELVL